jgi:four helix bundle protein
MARHSVQSVLRRAAVSIPFNLAEGHCRRTTKAFANHDSIALGSNGELETCLELAVRMGFLKGPEATQLLSSAHSVGRLPPNL